MLDHFWEHFCKHALQGCSLMLSLSEHFISTGKWSIYWLLLSTIWDAQIHFESSRMQNNDDQKNYFQQPNTSAGKNGRVGQFRQRGGHQIRPRRQEVGLLNKWSPDSYLSCTFSYYSSSKTAIAPAILIVNDRYYDFNRINFDHDFI